MSEIDQQFIEYVVKSLVGNPDAVHIDRRIDEKGVLLELTVAPEDLGRVIGKRGATAQSLRTLLRALGTKNDARYNLKIVDNGVNSQSRESTDDKSSDESSSEEPVMPDEPNSTSDAKEEPAATETQEEQTSDRLKQAREELADLDDLDV
jgi:predicted RNA-binding protein YlqC (UPF0109 family)